jgi:hypothetical protein
MLPKEIAQYNYRGKYVKMKIYYKYCFLEMDDMFKSNRKFNSWEEAFKPSLKAQKETWKYKKRSYSEAANRFPKKIINIFLNLLVDDLIYNDVEFVLNPRSEEQNQFTLKLGYFNKSLPHEERYKRSKYIYKFGGLCYYLRAIYPRNWPNRQIFKRFIFYFPYRAKVWKQLKLGHRYYNSAMEHLIRKYD